MSLYNAKTDTGAQSYGVSQFIVTKFDDDLNVEASYLVSTQGCTCPAGHRPSCRHRQMLPMLETRVNSAFFLDFDTRQWVDPTGSTKLVNQFNKNDLLARGIIHEDPQGSLGSSPPATEISNPPTIIEGNPTSESQRDSFIRASDSHPFRRRM